MAARWEDFADDGDGYLLQYRTAGDDKVRPEHAALNGVTLPKSDSFWDSYYPPNGWNCRCTVVEVLAPKYPTTDHNEAMQRGEKALSKDSKGMFRFNPGKQERTSPAYNPYTISRCNGYNLSEFAGGKGPDPNNPLCQACQYLHTCYGTSYALIETDRGQVRINRTLYLKKDDYETLVSVAKDFANQLGKSVTVLPDVNRKSSLYAMLFPELVGTVYDRKCPDLRIDGKLYEVEGYKSLGHAIGNMITRGRKQCPRIIIERPGTMSDRTILRQLQVRLSKISKDDPFQVEEVWVHDDKGVTRLI